MEELQRQALMTLLGALGLVWGAWALLTWRDRRGEGALARRARGDWLPEVLGVWGVVAPLYLGVGAVLQSVSLEGGILVSQLAFLAGPSLALGPLLGRAAPSLLRLAPVPGGLLLAGGLIGAGVWLPIGAWLTLQEWLAPMPEALAQLFEDQILPDTPAELAVALVLFAALPAVCEELFFRGALQGLLAGRSRWLELGLPALLFGITHMIPHRVLPTALLGLALGELRRRTGSILPGVVVHATHNALLLTVGTRLEEMSASQAAPWAALALLSLGLGVGVVARRGSGAGGAVAEQAEAGVLLPRGPGGEDR